MPENYQAILSDLGVDTTQQPDQPSDTPATTPAPVNNEADNAETPADNAVATENTSTPAQPEAPKESEQDTRRNEAFAAMRAENTKYKQFMQHLMKGADFRGDEATFMSQLSEASYKRQAQRQGNQVSPELLERMDNLEAQNKAYLEERNRSMFTSNLANLQSTFELSDAEVKEFVDLAVKEHIDLTIPGTNFVTLYQGLFFDKILDKKIEQARQTWIAQDTKANNAANPDGKSGKKDPAPTNVNTMAEFESHYIILLSGSKTKLS